METATSKSSPPAARVAVLAVGGKKRARAAIVALALAAAGCGANGPASRGGGSDVGGRAFAWLVPEAAPADWPVATIPDGAAMPYPPHWRRVNGDPGTATAVLSDPHHPFLGYLNVTPRQGEETPANWTTFRVAHNADEGDRRVATLAAADGLRFRTGAGACVNDAYTTSAGVRYVELACLVSGSRGGSVIVGAAPASAWKTISPLLERAISAFTTAT